ncbi:MAG: exodeoxyribonuclease VII small subunit [Gammaproteobacteria bacterium]|nr:exodeoxyribonuclease VII small subunit [Gammaproteobacteria bacterium]MCP5418702.1 exodeoxyribonuclease VII small subunit [Chromatiaceae bacterium]
MAENKDPVPPFEQALSELEKLVESLERGEMSLEDSLQTFERGVELTRICQQSLKKAEQRVSILNQKSSSAGLDPFEKNE